MKFTTATPRPALPPRQQVVLDFIATHIERRGFAPSVREIAKQLGMRSTNAVCCHLLALERKGFIRRDSMKSRTIQVLAPIGDEPATYSELVEDLMQARMSALDEEIAGLKARLAACTCGAGATP